jgi:hypothetical protein
LALGLLSAIGFLLLAEIIVQTGIVTLGGSGGVDAYFYWLGAHRLATGAPLYARSLGDAAYRYAPPMAQVAVAFGLLPAFVFVNLWRAIELVCLRYVMGSWRATGLALLFFPPSLAEIQAGNVHLLMAAAVAAAMRGDATSALPIGAFTKFATFVAVPRAFVQDRRGLLRGLAVTAIVTLVSYLLAPGLWSAWVGYLLHGAAETPNRYDLDRFAPPAVRLVLAVLLSVAAIRAPRLLGLAATLAYPVLWFNSLSTLLACIAPLPKPRVAGRGPSPRAHMLNAQ